MCLQKESITALSRLDAQGGLACLAQTRQNRPGIGELDLTNTFLMQGMAAAIPYMLPTIPQKGRDIQVVPVGRG